MKIFYSEYQSNYTSYTFSYAVYCHAEDVGEFSKIYQLGFLPYTGNYTLQQNIFYLARSLRVNLAHFKDTSENKRINRKVEELEVSMAVNPRKEIQVDDDFLRFCGSFAQERFSENQNINERLEYILSRDILTHVISFTSKGVPVGYVYTFISEEVLHYWFSFYDTTYLRSHSLGKWMMWKVIRWAQEQGLQYAYLGTCYTTKALYKARNHKGVEFYDGHEWNNDIKLLKHLCQLDENSAKPIVDLYKSDVSLPESAIFHKLQ